MSLIWPNQKFQKLLSFIKRDKVSYTDNRHYISQLILDKANYNKVCFCLILRL